MGLVKHFPLCVLLLSFFRKDPTNWCLSSFTVSEVTQLCNAIGLVGLPAFLRKAKVQFSRTRPPYVNLFITSKCWSDSGVHRCEVPGHACIRRVCSYIGIPWRTGWSVISRGLTAIQMSACESVELFDISRLAPQLSAAVRRLPPPSSTCVECGCPKPLQVINTFDVDQAFEACASDRIV